MKEKVVVELRNDSFDKCYRLKCDGTIASVVERDLLLHPEHCEIVTQTYGERNTRKLTYLEIEMYIFSKVHPEAYTKIADVIRRTNPVLLAAITFVTMSVDEARNNQISMLRQNLELLSSQDYVEYSDVIQTLRSDKEVWRLIGEKITR